MKYSVKEFRVRHELTQKEMSDLLGVSPRMVQKYESGESPLPEDKQIRMELFESSNASTSSDPTTPEKLTPKNAVRYYPDIPITASHIEDMPNPSYDDMQYQLLSVPGFEGCVAFPAVGDSMYPRISNGDIVVFREWQESYISNGEIYLIITRLGDRTIKYLTQITDEDGGKHYLCRSANPDQEKYAPFEIDGDDIVRLYVVYGCIKKFRL